MSGIHPSIFISYTRADTQFVTQLENTLRGKSIEAHEPRDSPLFQVCFGTHDDAGDLIHSAEINDFVIDDLDHVEGFAGRDRIDEHVSVNANGMFRVEYRVLVLGIRVRMSMGELPRRAKRLTWPAVSMMSQS